MTNTGTKPNVTAPTVKELRKGPVVKLTRPGWEYYSWSPHGFDYPIRFTDGSATVLTEHFDAWVGNDTAKSLGMTVTRPKKK